MVIAENKTITLLQPDLIIFIIVRLFQTYFIRRQWNEESEGKDIYSLSTFHFLRNEVAFLKILISKYTFIFY